MVGSIYLPQRDLGADAFMQACHEVLCCARDAQRRAKGAYGLPDDPVLLMGGDFNYELREATVHDGDGHADGVSVTMPFIPGLGMEPQCFTSLVELVVTAGTMVLLPAAPTSLGWRNRGRGRVYDYFAVDTKATASGAQEARDLGQGITTS